MPIDNINPSALSSAEISHDAIDARGELLRRRLAGIRPDLVTALALLGIAILQLRQLNCTNASIRKNVERWLHMRPSTTSHGRVWRPSTGDIVRTILDTLKRKGKDQ